MLLYFKYYYYYDDDDDVYYSLIIPSCNVCKKRKIRNMAFVLTRQVFMSIYPLCHIFKKNVEKKKKKGIGKPQQTVTMNKQ